MLGAVSLVGLSELLPKGMALGRLPPDHPEALSRRAVALGRFLVQGVYVMLAEGIAVAHELPGTRSTGLNLAFRPYFQQAIQGATSVYAAIGSNTQERGLYYAARLYESDTPSSNIIDVVMFRGGFEPVDLLLKPALCAVARHRHHGQRHHGQRRRGGPPALLCGRHESPCCQAHRACGPVGCAGLCVQARVFARPVLLPHRAGQGHPLRP